MQPVSVADRSSLLALEADPEVMRFINGGRPVPPEGVDPTAKFLTPRGGEPEVWSAFEQGSDEFVGWFSLQKREKGVGELGYRLRAEKWGQGFGSEGARIIVARGFRDLHLERITATTMAVNRASRRVMEKAGLKHIRTIYPDWTDPIAGSEYGEVEYEITRPAFTSVPPVPPPARRHPLVRRARLEDADLLEAILRNTFESTWKPVVSEAAFRAFVAEDRPADFVGRLGLDFWVAEVEGEVVGLVYWNEDFVHSLHVLGSHARQGVGARLMDIAEDQIAAAGFSRTRLETDTFNSTSRAFYEAEATGKPVVILTRSGTAD